MTHKQKDFVNQYLKHRCKITAHNIAYGENSNYDSVESSANRLLRIPEIAETIRQVEDTICHEVEEEFKAKYREELLTIYDKRLLLKKIATGEIYIEQNYKGKNCTQCSQYISSNINQMLAGLREDSKVAGHYPYKQNGKWIIPAQQTEQVHEVSLSPAGGGVSLSADGGGTLAQDESNEKTPEKDDNGQRPSEASSMSQIEKTTISELTMLSPAAPVPQDCGRGVSPTSEGGGMLAPDENTNLEKDNKGQQITETTSDNQPLTQSNSNSISRPFTVSHTQFGRGIGGQLSQENTLENDNKTEQISETTTDNQPLTQTNSDSISRPFTVSHTQFGRGIGGQPAKDSTPEKDDNGQQPGEASSFDNTPEKDLAEPCTCNGADNNLAELLNERNEKDNKKQQTEETTIDNQPLTMNTSPLGVGGTHDNIPIISQEKLRVLLYPLSAAVALSTAIVSTKEVEKEAKKPKLSYMKNNP